MVNMELTLDGDKVITEHLNGHTIRTDQPIKDGGGNTAPAPFELFLASIGTCAGFYVKSFCDQTEIPSKDIKIIQSVEFDNETKLPANIIFELKITTLNFNCFAFNQCFCNCL